VGTRKGGLRVYVVDVFVSICENRRMIPVEIVLRRGKGEKEKMMGGGGKCN
jgi:hypothetical protein